MAGGIRTPLDTGSALALGNRRYRKQLLKEGPLHYQGGVRHITGDYLDKVVTAFDAKAQRRVPFQLADAQNQHTMDPLRRKGFVTALHRTSEGLDAVVELEDEAAALVDSDPEFGVSVYIDEVTTGEGQHYDAALFHVLGTYSPVCTSLSDWTLAASQPSGEVLDLLALSTTSTDQDDPDTSEEDAPMPKLADMLAEASEDELRDLRTKLDALHPADDAVGDDETDVEEVTDEEIEQALADADDLEDEADDTDDEAETVDEDDETDAVAAGHVTGDTALALANAAMSEELSSLRTSQQEMTRRLNEADWNERSAALREAGVPPILIERAKPALHGNDTSLRLSQADRTKTATLVEGLLTETGKLMAALGIGHGALGTAHETPAEQAEHEQRQAAVKAHLEQSGQLKPSRA